MHPIKILNIGKKSILFVCIFLDTCKQSSYVRYLGYVDFEN